MTQKHMEAYLPASQRQQILEIGQDMNKAVAGFLRGRLLIGFLMAVMFAVGWLLANVPYWFLLGVTGGILGIIPYASGAVWLLAVLLKYLNVTVGKNVAGVDWMVIAGWPTVVYVIVQFIEGWVLTPWVQSEETNLSPVAVLVAVFIGGGVAGLYGLILAVPVVACLKILAVKILLSRLRQWASGS